MTSTELLLIITETYEETRKDIQEGAEKVKELTLIVIAVCDALNMKAKKRGLKKGGELFWELEADEVRSLTQEAMTDI